MACLGSPIRKSQCFGALPKQASEDAVLKRVGILEFVDERRAVLRLDARDEVRPAPGAELRVKAREEIAVREQIRALFALPHLLRRPRKEVRLHREGVPAHGGLERSAQIEKGVRGGGRAFPGAACKRLGRVGKERGKGEERCVRARETFTDVVKFFPHHFFVVERSISPFVRRRKSARAVRRATAPSSLAARRGSRPLRAARPPTRPRRRPAPSAPRAAASTRAAAR